LSRWLNVDDGGATELPSDVEDADRDVDCCSDEQRAVADEEVDSTCVWNGGGSVDDADCRESRWRRFTPHGDDVGVAEAR
jgi:hypothetical protein